MPRQTTISTTLAGAPTRELTLTYCDDPPERSEAVAFFQQLERGLTPVIALPDVIRELPLDEVQPYLDEHPTLQEWTRLEIRNNDAITDDDLAGLAHISEIQSLKIASNSITNSSVRHIATLKNLRSLTLYSVNMTDDGLGHLASLADLQMLDMQLSLRVSGAGFAALVARLPAIVDSKPPFEAPLSPVMKASPFVPPGFEFRSLPPRRI
jgi:Leucine-rich repeat (LRR) protein